MLPRSYHALTPLLHDCYRTVTLVLPRFYTALIPQLTWSFSCVALVLPRSYLPLRLYPAGSPLVPRWYPAGTPLLPWCLGFVLCTSHKTQVFCGTFNLTTFFLHNTKEKWHFSGCIGFCGTPHVIPVSSFARASNFFFLFSREAQRLRSGRVRQANFAQSA